MWAQGFWKTGTWALGVWLQSETPPPVTGGGITFHLPRYKPSDQPARQQPVEETEALLLAMIY